MKPNTANVSAAVLAVPLLLISAAAPLYGQLELAEVGGTFAEANFAAQSVGGVAFASDVLEGFDAHQIPHLNDEIYGNSNSWIGNSVVPPFVGIALAAPARVASIAWGRDNGGEAQEFVDRHPGLYELQYTAVPNPDATTADADWVTIGQVEYTPAFPPFGWRRHRYNFEAINGVTGLRLLVPGTGVVGGTAIDEIEIYSTPGEILVELCPGLPLSETGGPAATPAAAADVPGLADGNLSLSPDAVPFGTPPHPNPAHEIAHLNDGLYGNSQSWLGWEPGPASGDVYAGIYFSDEMKDIQAVALGRDNTGAFGDRAAGPYSVEVTQDSFDPTDDASISAATWTCLGEGTAHLTDGSPALRHVYCPGLVRVRAVRIVTLLGNAIDELEVLGPGSVRDLELAEEGGELADGNLSTAPEAVAFASDVLAGFDAHQIPHLNDGLYGNSNSWIGNAATPPFVGISFGAEVTVSSIAFGRDNGGEEQVFSDRSTGRYLLQFTTVESPDETTSNCDWSTMGQVVIGAFCPGTPWLRHRYNFEPVGATGIRLIVPATGLGGGTAIDELEAYSDAGEVTLDCVVPEILELVETGGPMTTPAAPEDVPVNLSLAADAVAFGTPPHPVAAHEISHLNDGLYGNSQSWLGNEVGPVSGEVYAGIYLMDGPARVNGIALGRDNTGQFADRSAGSYVIQHTLDTFDPTDDASIDGAGWVTLGLAQDHLTDGTPNLRHRYAFETVEVRAVRVVTRLGNAIDEIELLAPSFQIAGDCNQDGVVNVSDVSCYVRLQFPGFDLVARAAEAPCGGTDLTSSGNVAVLDVDGSSIVDVNDIVYLAQFLFAAGSPPQQGAGCLLFAAGECQTNSFCD